MLLFILKTIRLYYSSDQLKGSYNAEDILHFKLITNVNATTGFNKSRWSGILGMSPITQCKNAIGWSMDVEEYSEEHFSNHGAKLSGLLKTSRSLSEQAIDRLRNSFNNNYSSLSGSNQTAVLEEGLEFQPLSNPTRSTLNFYRVGNSGIAEMSTDL